jgi:excisionase family DNA binding protein
MTEDADRLLTVSEIAEVLRVDATTIRRWIKRGNMDALELPHRGNRRVYRVRRATIDRILATPVEVSAV